jgi:hypothetical protein
MRVRVAGLRQQHRADDERADTEDQVEPEDPAPTAQSDEHPADHWA